MEPDARLPEWILDRTPAEVKAAYAAAIRKREQGQARRRVHGSRVKGSCSPLHMHAYLAVRRLTSGQLRWRTTHVP